MTIQDTIISDLKELIIDLEGYRKDAEIAIEDLQEIALSDEFALSDEIKCLTQVSFTLGNAVGILQELRRNYAASKTSNKNLG